MFPHVSILCPHAHFSCCMKMCVPHINAISSRNPRMCPHVDNVYLIYLCHHHAIASSFSSLCPHTVRASICPHTYVCPHTYICASICICVCAHIHIYVCVSSYPNSDALGTKYLAREVVRKPFSLPGSGGGWLLVYTVFMHVCVLMHKYVCSHAYVHVSSCICMCTCPHA